MNRERISGPDLDLLVADTRKQLDEATAVLRDGGLVEIQALAPRIQLICELAVAQRRIDMAPHLLGLMETLDTLETLLRAAVARSTSTTIAQAEHNPHRAAKAYRATSETYIEESGEPPPSPQQTETQRR